VPDEFFRPLEGAEIVRRGTITLIGYNYSVRLC
jgi:hypothetical protein